MWEPPPTYHLWYIRFLIIGLLSPQMWGALSLPRNGIPLYSPQMCVPLPPSNPVCSLSSSKALPTLMGCQTLRPVGVGLILSPSPTRSSRAGSLCTVHVGSQLGGKEWGPDRLAETMADGPIEKGGSPRTCSLLTWTPTPFPLGGGEWGQRKGNN